MRNWAIGDLCQRLGLKKRETVLASRERAEGKYMHSFQENKELFYVLRQNVRKVSLQGFVIKRITEIIVDFQDEFTRKTKFYNPI